MREKKNCINITMMKWLEYLKRGKRSKEYKKIFIDILKITIIKTSIGQPI